MPRFPTSTPVALTVELILADVRVTASDRDDAVVAVRPADPGDGADVKAAEQIRIEHDGDRLVVRTASRWRQFSPFGPGSGAVEVAIDVPTGSSLEGTVGMGSVIAEGELGACRLRSGMGDLRVDHTGDLRLRTGHGEVAADRVAGDAEVSTGSGEVRLGEVTGTAQVRNSNGVTRIGAVGGYVRVKSASGDIVIGRAGASVTATAATGDVRVAEVRRGVVVLKTSAGELAVGVRAGTAAWLDVSSHYGRVHNTLQEAGAPGPTEETVEVRGRTSYGDIVIHRAEGDPPPDATRGAA